MAELVVVELLVLVMPVFVLATVVVIAPSALRRDAVILSIIDISATVAPDIKISSDSDFTSNKLPNAWLCCFGTTTNVTMLLQ